jgi:uncharacterized SAM-binding protein YcdF (DUF218 family)
MIYEFDAALVLACGINEDGSLPHDPIESVDIVTDLYLSNRAPLIIFSGNLSYKADSVPPQTESGAMAVYAQQSGIPSEAILIENESKDTLGNAYFTKVRYLIPGQLRSLAVVLGPNHSLERVKYIFDKVLGSEYDTTFIEHNAGREAEVDREAQSLTVLKEWLDATPSGDHASVYRIMRDVHPGYSSEPEKAWQKLHERFGK